MAKQNREYKDSVFVDLFYKDESAKKNLLDLHNALYNTFYTDPEQIRLIGLEDVLFRNFKNDVAFSVEEREIVLSEHQSTVNPNMPLRNLLYIAREYEKILPVTHRYKTSLVKIPIPKFVVFYNGTRNYPMEKTLKLSDSFLMQEGDDIELELTVRVININTSKKHPILEKCRVLKEYSLFVETTRKYEHTKDQLEQAVKECIKNGILRDYLLKKGNEVINMLMAEYSYETDIEVQREEAAEEANKRAEEAEKKAEEVSRKLENANRETADAKKKAAEADKRADKLFIDFIEKTAKNFQLSIKDTCNRLGESYDDYLKIKETL